MRQDEAVIMTRRYDPQTIEATLRLLSERWPCFVLYERKRRPLKLRIDQAITAALGDTITPDALAIALRFYTGNTFYLRACTEGAVRVGLDGEPVGTVTEHEAAHAARARAQRLAKSAAKKLKLTSAQQASLAPRPVPKRISFRAAVGVRGPLRRLFFFWGRAT
jgi:ProP effector